MVIPSYGISSSNRKKWQYGIQKKLQRNCVSPGQLYSDVTLEKSNATGKKTGGFKRVLTEEMERSLARYIITMEEMMFGIGPLEVRRLAFQLGEINGLKHSFKSGKAGTGRLRGFLSKNNE